MSDTATATPVKGDIVAEDRQRIEQATKRAFLAESASRQRDPHHFSLSKVGGCRRAAAYTIARTPVSDPDLPVSEGRAANLGTWEHAGLLPRLAEQLPGAAVEVPVKLRLAGLVIPGSIDLDDPLTVVDLKTVGEYRLSGVIRTNAAYYNHKMQGGGYALARLQEGRPPRSVAFHYLDRANGEECIVVNPFTNSYAAEVVDRVEEVVEMAESPDTAPRDERGPGLSFSCDECPWLRRCWGPDAEPGDPKAVAVHTDPELEAALLLYDDARARESRAKDDKKYAVALLGDAPYGKYGRATYKRGKPGNREDPHASARKLKALGLPVPRQDTRGAISIKITDPPALVPPVEE